MGTQYHRRHGEHAAVANTCGKKAKPSHVSPSPYSPSSHFDLMGGYDFSFKNGTLLKEEQVLRSRAARPTSRGQHFPSIERGQEIVQNTMDSADVSSLSCWCGAGSVHRPLVV